MKKWSSNVFVRGLCSWGQTDLEFSPEEILNRSDPEAPFCRNSNAVNGEETHRDPRSHTLPTSDPDLAFIVGLWDRLADECKARLIEVIRENLPG